jgi:hypothetical protein
MMKEFRNLYSSLDSVRVIKIKEDDMGRTCSIRGGNEKRFNILVRKLNGRDLWKIYS